MRKLWIAALFLAGCATVEEAPEPAPAPAPDRGLSEPDVLESAPYRIEEIETAAGRTTTVERVKDFLPFIDVAMDPNAANSYYGVALEDRYTRIKIETLNPKASDMEGTASGEYTAREADRDYSEESRGWLSRMFSSKTVTRTLMTEFELDQPDVKASEALFSASFSSNREDGESWSTDQSLAVYATPWFRISANTTLTTKLRMQLADQRESTSASANVLGTLSSAANMIAPTTSLITYFNAPAMTNSANFLDSSVSTLFGRAITEQSTGTMALKTWTDEPLLVVYAAMPDAKDIRKTDDRDMLGGWAIYLEEPIVSVFTRDTKYSDDGSDIVPNYSSTNGSDILAFEVDRNLTLYDYVFSKLNIADRISELNDTGDKELARLICNRMERGLTEFAGLNAWDTSAVIYAAATSDMMTMTAQDVLIAPDTCQAMQRYNMINPRSTIDTSM